MNEPGTSEHPRLRPATGDALQRARHERGLTLAQVAAALHLDEGDLAALEQGVAPEGMTEAVMLAQLRMYARWIGLDAEALLRAERPPTHEEHLHPAAFRRRRRMVPVGNRTLAAALVLLAVGIVAGILLALLLA